ncbi:hypothetical protein DOM21_13125 [Bacteriovorax stolpii]|uniref:protein-disulfide reductase DsbD family protein n=1 Tax=Bacteriovorax stolpii TaxID=960 RepID=UPI001157E52D|nr:thioredoxin family protein [Bacteriovorax stolpii]QDK42368.1 hypothetical protein DOM21_13125 [Bacteriovorax stolpii]
MTDKFINRFYVYILFLISFSMVTYSNISVGNSDIPEKPVELSLQTLRIENQDYLVLSFKNFPEWHTYWKNPGDAGLPIKNSFSINQKEIAFEEQEWPVPKKFIQPGNLWGYGYEGEYSLFYKLTKDKLVQITNQEISLDSKWLSCKHICIPGQQKAKFKFNQLSEKIDILSSGLMKELDQTILIERFSKLPKFVKDIEIDLNLSRGISPKSLTLSYESKTKINLNKDFNFLYIFPTSLLDIKHEGIRNSEEKLLGTTEILWDGEYSNPPEPLPGNGIFKMPLVLKFLVLDLRTNEFIVSERTFKGFSLTPVRPIKPAEQPKLAVEIQSSSSIPSSSLALYIVMAFLGGLILNVMPCVLPVITIKLFSLIKYKEQSHRLILKHNFFYTLGILSTFLLLASIVLFLKSIGTQVGWGFQLQSPYFVSFMILGLFLFSLNLFGMFEFATVGGNKLGNLKPTEGFVGDYFSGVLATVLSTPCSAPFLGTALTFAFTSSSFQIYIIFLMIGLGLSFPFILTSIYPGLVFFLPKPGPWMIKVKKILGVTLLLTLFWLIDVYNALVSGSPHFIKLLFCLVFIFGGFLFQKRNDKWISYISFGLAVALLTHISITPVIFNSDNDAYLISDKNTKGLDWEIWSELRMEEYKKSGDLVFIDFTAKWCFTCKVNEKLVLETNAFKSLAKEYNLKLLIADWTKRDPVIESFLRRNGLVGVPAYFIQNKDGTLINLGETISIDSIKKNLK